MTIPYSSSLSALSSVAHEELLELERKESIRRARYEATRAELEARVAKPSRSAGASPESTPFFGPITSSYASSLLPQHSVYCDGDSLTGHGGLTPRLPACHHDECHKSYRTLLKMANRLGNAHEVLSSHYSHAESGSGGGHGHHLTSHAHSATNHARSGHHRHHPYEVPQLIPGRKLSPVDTTPSPISTDDSSELPPLPLATHHHAPTSSSTGPGDNYEYYTPSTSPFLRAVRNMNVGRSRTSSRVPSRAPSPVPLHLPPAITAISSVGYDSVRSTIGRSDRHHRSHRSHPSLHSPQDAGAASDHQYYPYPHSHGGTPPGTPAPLMMGRQKRANSGGVASQPSKHSINALLSGNRRDPVSTDMHYTMDATAAPTPSLSSSSNSSVSGGRHFESDITMSPGEPVYNNPPLSFPPPPSRSRSDILSPVSSRSLAGSPEATSTIHAAFSSSSHPPLPPLIPGPPSSSSSASASTTPLSLSRGSGSTLSSPTTPNSSSHSHLAHSVRIAFGMTPIHPPNYFSSSRGRSTIGFGNSSVRGSARGSSPPIILPPLKIAGIGIGANLSRAGSEEDGRESDDVKLPHLDSLTRLVEVRESLQSRDRMQDDMDVDDLH